MLLRAFSLARPRTSAPALAGWILAVWALSASAHAADRYWVAGAPGNWNDTANWSTSSGGAGGSSVPGASDKAIFDGNGTGNCTLNVNVSVGGMDLQAGYAGTLTQGSGNTLTVGGSNFVQAGGTFAGGDSAMDFNGTFTLSGGTFTATSATASAASTFTISGGTFAHNSGTILFDGSGQTVNAGSATLYHVSIDVGNSNSGITVTGTLAVAGLFHVIDAASISSGTVSCTGNVRTTDTTVTGTGTVLFTGTANQTLDANGGTGALPAISVNKSGGTLTLQDTIQLDDSSRTIFTYVAGTVDAGTSVVVINGNAATVDAGAMAFHDFTLNLSNPASTFAVSGTLNVAGTLRLTAVAGVNTGTISCTGNVISTDVSNQGSATVLFTGSGNQTLSADGGTGALPAVTIDKSGGTLTLQDTIRVDAPSRTIWTYTAGTVDAGTSTVSFRGTGSTVSAGAMSFYNVVFDLTNAASSFTVTGTLDVNGSCAFTGITNLSGGTLTVAGNLSSTDTTVGGTTALTLDGTGAQTITATGGGDFPNGTITVNKASGTATLASAVNFNGTGQDLAVTAGTLDLAGYNLTVADALSIGASGTVKLQGGETLTRASFSSHATGTVQYAGSGTYTSLPLGNSYAHLTFDGTGTWKHAALLTVTGNLSIVQGTLDSNGQNVSLQGNWSNTGTYTGGGNTVTLAGGSQTLSGDSTFHHLTKRSGQAATLTFQSGKTQTITGTLELQGAPGNLLSLRSSSSGTDWYLDPQGARVLAFLDVKDSNNVDATAAQATDTSVDSGANTNWSFAGAYAYRWSGGGADENWNTTGNWQGGAVPGADYVALFDGISTKNCTVNVAATVRGLGIRSGYTGTITQGSGIAVTLGDAGYQQSAGAYACSTGALDVNGPVILSGGTLTASSGAFTVAGDWRKSGGTFDGASGTVTFDGTLLRTVESGGTGAASDFNHLTLTATGATVTLATDDLKVSGNLTLTSGTLDLGGQDLFLAGNLTRTGATLTTGSSILTFEGSGTQTADFGGAQVLGTLKSDKSGGSVAFTHGFTATTLEVSSADTVQFGAGKTFTVTNLTLSGSAGNPVALRSTGSSPTDTYFLHVSGTQAIAYADFKHCDASAGTLLDATDNGVDSKFNTNVDFGSAPVLLYATAHTDDLTKVYLRYDQAMGSSAANTANYALSGGLSVSAASLSVDKKLVTLTASTDVTIGTTTVTANTSILSLVGRSLANTVLTVEAGTDDGIPDADAVGLALTTDGNHSVILNGPTFSFTGVPASIGEELTVTAPGTGVTNVDLVQMLEGGGSSKIYFGTSGSATSTTVTTSGGTPNQAKVAVRYQAQGAFENDFTIRAFISETERGAKLATAVKATISPKCTGQLPSNQVIKTISTAPAISGLGLEATTYMVTGNTASETGLSGFITDVTTGGDGKVTFERYHIGREGYVYICWSPTRSSSSTVDPSYLDEDHYCCSPPFCPGPPDSGPNHGTVNSFMACPCIDYDYRGGQTASEMAARCGMPNSIDPSDGQKKLDLTDLSIPGRGFDYVFRRTYRSLSGRVNIVNRKDFGEFWTYSYADEFLVKDGTGADNASNYINYRDGHSGIAFVNTGTGTWGAQFSQFVRMSINAGGEIEIREESGNVRVYHDFSTGTTPNVNGRLKRVEDRNGNSLTCLYDEIDPDNTVGGDSKYVLTRVIDTLGREIRYQYYAKTAQADGARTLTLTTANAAAYGRLAKVLDFKDNMDFAGSPSQAQDFSGQVRNRTLTFDYDSEGNLVRASRPAIAATPNGNDFASGKTTRYQYILTSDLASLVTGYGAMSGDQQAVVQRFLLHKLIRIWHPNEVQSTPGSDPASGDAAETMTYVTSFSFTPSDSRFLTLGTLPGFIATYAVGGTNGNDVPSGGTLTYTYTNLSSNFSTTAGLSTNPVPHYNKQIFKIEIADRAGHEAEAIYGGGGNLLSYKIFTQGLRDSEPADYTTTYTSNKDRLLKTRTSPEGNLVTYSFNESSTDRFQQSNAIRTVITPDVARGGDQSKIETVAVWEPIYNRPYLTISARGADMNNNGFTPPLSDPASRTMVDPYDANKTLNMRYARIDFFDFQESAAASTAWGATSAFTPTSVDSVTVKATEVLLLRELRLAEGPSDTERANSIRTVRTRLSSNLLKLGLGDLNGDGNTDPVVSGNVVRTAVASPVLLANTNQHALEGQIETAGDLIDQSLALDSGGTAEGAHGSRLQTIVTLHQYNAFGQLVKSISPEGNVASFEYFPEEDPDGDTVVTPAPADGRTLSDTSGGYLKEVVQDDARSYKQQTTGNDLTGDFSNNDTDPDAAEITSAFAYDDVGNTIATVNARGIKSAFFVNEHNEVVQVTRASDISAAASASPADPLYNHADAQQELTAFAYLSRTFFDFNGNVVLSQVEDRANTSGVDGSGLGTLPSQATGTTPGLSSADGSGGVAYVDSLNLFDRLDNLVETRVEVDGSRALATKLRYDANQNRVLTIYPEGNADGAVFDERNLLFQSVRGVSTRPSEGLYAAGDPTAFNRAGGSGTVASTATFNYDKNRNLVETVDAADHGGQKSSIHPTGGTPGDVTRIAYDGFDRRKSVTDAMGNETFYVYDPDSNVIRVIQDGDPLHDDDSGSGSNKTLAVTEYVHDELSRVICTHQVLFQTPDVSPDRTPTLSDTADMDALAAYLADAGSDTASVPDATGISVIGRVTTIAEFDRESRVTFRIADDLDTFRTDFDGASRAVKTTDGALANGYDGTGDAFVPGDLLGNTVETAYDDASNAIERLETDLCDTDGDGDADITETFRTTYLYDALDRLQTVFDNRGQAEDYRYDSRSNLVARADAVGPVDARAFDRRGLGSSASVPINDYGNVTRTRFDGLSRTLETEAVLTASGEGDGTNLGATLEGQLDTTPTADTNQSTDGLISVYYAWDDNSQLLALRDDNGNTTVYVYDNQNRTLVERKGLDETGTGFSISGGDSGSFNVSLRGGASPTDTEADGTDIAYAYDADSNVTLTTDEAGNEFECTFDALNRKTLCEITRAGGFIGTTEQTWQFDGLSRMELCTDNNDPGTGDDDIVCDYFYDSLSRKVEERQKIGSGGTPRAVSCNFDIAASGSVGGCSADFYPDGRRTNNAYDTLDRLVSRTDNGAGSAIGSYLYIGKWRVATLTFQNDSRLTHLNGTSVAGFDTLRRIVNHRWETFTTQTPGNGTLLVGFEHQDAGGPPNSLYDRANNKKIEYKSHDSTNSLHEQYRYDSVYRLASTGAGGQSQNSRGFERGSFSSSARTGIATTSSYQDWDLDGVGNWPRFDNDGSVDNRTHSDFNEIVSASSFTHVHDVNGNLTDDDTRELEWDALNRLKRVTRKSDSEVVAEYVYDCHNRRMVKVVTNGGIPDDAGLNGTTRFYYHGWRVVEERDGSDGILRQFTYGNYLDEVWTLDDRDGVSVADLNDGTGDERLFFHSNTLYHVYANTDEAGAIKEAVQAYDAYGKATVITGAGTDTTWFTSDDVTASVTALGNPCFYTGQRVDAETRLGYWKNRYYVYELGRWASRDPAGYAAGENLYHYVSSRPTYYADAYGLNGDIVDVAADVLVNKEDFENASRLYNSGVGWERAIAVVAMGVYSVDIVGNIFTGPAKGGVKKIAKEVAEKAAKEAAEKAAREAAERAAREAAEKAAKQKAEQEAAAQAAKVAREKEAAERAAKAATEAPQVPHARPPEAPTQPRAPEGEIGVKKASGDCNRQPDPVPQPAGGCFCPVPGALAEGCLGLPRWRCSTKTCSTQHRGMIAKCEWVGK